MVPQTRSFSASSAVALAFVAVLLASMANAVPIAEMEMQPAQAKPIWQWMYLTMGWPASLCDTQQGCNIPTGSDQPIESWFLHGLWPNFENGTWPSFCDPSDPFSRDKISSLLPQMAYYWPAVLTDTQDQFWGHEWEKHGTCASPVLTSEIDYFSKTLELRRSLNFTTIMTEANIMPSNTPYFTAVEFANRFGKAFGYMPDLRCNKAKDGSVQLQELWLCVSPSLEFMDCPPEQHTHGEQYSACGEGKVSFLPLVPQFFDN